MEEKIYDFEFTENDIEVIKSALRLSGLEFNSNRSIYKHLCEAIFTEYDKELLKRYENGL